MKKIFERIVDVRSEDQQEQEIRREKRGESGARERER